MFFSFVSHCRVKCVDNTKELLNRIYMCVCVCMGLVLAFNLIIVSFFDALSNIIGFFLSVMPYTYVTLWIFTYVVDVIWEYFKFLKLIVKSYHLSYVVKPT